MEKCSLTNHKESDAISFCGECKIYMCNKCEKHHSELFPNHNPIKLEKGKDTGELFLFCKEKTKLKDEKYGQHSECDICFLKDIENDKKNKLKENIKCLEDISIDLKQKINELKIIFEKIDKNKEELKTNIQKIFTKIRNVLNEREEELLNEVNNKYNKIFFNEDIIKQNEKLPNKIKISLEKGKEIQNNWNNNKLILLINNCLNIENNINEIKLLNDNILKTNSIGINIVFSLVKKV